MSLCLLRVIDAARLVCLLSEQLVQLHVLTSLMGAIAKHAKCKDKMKSFRRPNYAYGPVGMLAHAAICKKLAVLVYLALAR